MAEETHDARTAAPWGIVGTVGCFYGMQVEGGAEGVGKATTEAVVYSSITILICNFFLTLIIGKLVGLL